MPEPGPEPEPEPAPPRWRPRSPARARAGAPARQRERVEAVLGELRARGGRVTTARRALLTALFAADGHRTADELAAAVHAEVPDVHASTIYRNLEELQRLGVVEHSHLGHGPATYHLAATAHAHLVCSSCGRTLEAPDEMFAALARDLVRRFGFRLDAHHFALLGRCRDCAGLDPGPAKG